MNMPTMQIDDLCDESLLLTTQNDIDLCDRLENFETLSRNRILRFDFVSTHILVNSW